MRTMAAGRKHDRSFARAETELGAALEKARGDVEETFGAVAEAAARGLRRSDRTGAALLSQISALSGAAAQAAARTGSDMECAAQGFMFGVMFACMTKEARLLTLVRHTAGTFIKHAHEAGGDEAAAARGLVEGAISWAGDLDLGAAAAADAAGRGAAEAAEDVSPSLGGRVRAGLAIPVAGLDVRLEDTDAAAAAGRREEL